MSERDLLYREFLNHLELRAITLPQNSMDNIFHYFFELLMENEYNNLTGYHTIEEMIDYHLCDTLNLINICEFPENSIITDVGSGAGIPGLIIHLIRPDIQVFLIESIQKKVNFFNSFIKRYTFTRCIPVCNRAEVIAHDPVYREKSDIATARALAPLTQTLELTSAFSKVGGRIILPRGSSSIKESDTNNAEKILGVQLENRIPYSIPGRDRPFYLYIFKKIKETSSIYPRKPGKIKKQPL